MTEIPENVVYNCDFMKNRLPDHCADLIIADPPYFPVQRRFRLRMADVLRLPERCTPLG